MRDFLKGFPKKTGAAELFIFLNALVLHAFYIIYTPTWERQHDVIGFRNVKGIGQAALIEYLMNEGHFPDFDPTKKWGFFQPLLHHIIAAAVLKLNLMLGVGYDRACENIQVLTCFYSMVFIFYGFRLMKLMELKGKALLLSEALIAMHPILTLLSGSVNNDMLSHMFLIMAVYYALRWFKEDRLLSLLLTALSIGLSMMSKLSGVLVAPAVAFLMLYRLYEARGEKRAVIKRIREYLLFAVIVFPLGLFFPLRNLILFKVPLSYMPKVGEDISGVSLIRRIFDIRTNTPYACMVKNGDPYDEFNIFLLLIKTGLTGEYDYGGRVITFASWLLFLSGSALFLTVAILFFKVFFSGSFIKEVPIRVFWSILILTGIFFMLRLMLSVPNFSSGDLRYIAWITVPAAMLAGLYGKERQGFFGYRILEAMSLVFILSSAAVYYLLGIREII